MNLENLNKEIEKFQKMANIDYLPLYAQGKLDAYLELLPLVKKLTIPVVSKAFYCLEGGIKGSEHVCKKQCDSCNRFQQ